MFDLSKITKEDMIEFIRTLADKKETEEFFEQLRTLDPEIRLVFCMKFATNIQYGIGFTDGVRFAKIAMQKTIDTTVEDTLKRS